LVAQWERDLKVCGWNRGCRISASKRFTTQTQRLGRGAMFVPFHCVFILFSLGIQMTLEGLDAVDNFQTVEEKAYKSCSVDCTGKYFLHLFALNRVEVSVAFQLRTVLMMSLRCLSKHCVKRMYTLKDQVLERLLRVATKLDAFPALSVDPLWCYLGMGTTSFVIVAFVVCLILGIIWKAVSELKAFTLVLVGICVANAIRLAWWVLLNHSFMRYNTDSIRIFGQFIRIPDVIVLNIMSLTLLLFLFLWVDGMHSVLFPKQTKASLVFKIAFGTLAIVVTLYCLAIVIGK
jgi:hypothetical protein